MFFFLYFVRALPDRIFPLEEVPDPDAGRRECQPREDGQVR